MNDEIWFIETAESSISIQSLLDFAIKLKKNFCKYQQWIKIIQLQFIIKMSWKLQI